MDVKAVSGTQASVNMNSQNVEALDKRQAQRVQQEQFQQQVQKPQEPEVIPQEVLKDAISNLNKKLEMLNSQLKVETDEDTGARVIKIVDKETDEVIRQIPPEVILRIAKYLDEVAGLLFSEKV